MLEQGHDLRLSRRGLITLGGGAAAAGLLAGAPRAGAATARAAGVRHQKGKIPQKLIEGIVGAEGSVTNGVLMIGVDRDDIGPVKGPDGVVFEGAFEIDGMLTFQPLGNDLAFFNGCLALHEREVERFVDTIMANGLTFQALHQHYIGMKPQIWFVHWRGVGTPTALATGVHNVLRTTAIKLPQTMPKHPKSPLDAKRIGSIVGGSATVESDGVVSVDVERGGRIVIDGVLVSPDANISTNMTFKPLNKSGTLAAAAPDFSMTAPEIMPVMQTMRGLGWFVGCLYNQESDETPQLYFSHMVKKGDPYTLAAEIRQGLNHTKTKKS